MKPPVLYNNPKWEKKQFFDVLKLRSPRNYPMGLVFRFWDGSHRVSRMKFFGGWREWEDLDLFAAQAVVDHIFTPKRVRLWRRIKGILREVTHASIQLLRIESASSQRANALV